MPRLSSLNDVKIFSLDVEEFSRRSRLLRRGENVAKFVGRLIVRVPSPSPL